MSAQQYAYRAQKALSIVGGLPDCAIPPAFVAPDAPAKTHAYSADGRLYAYALPDAVRIVHAESGQLLQDLALPGIVEISFSPRGTYLATWERPLKLEDGAQHKNLRIFSVSTAQELVAFSQKSQDGWDVQYTVSESHAVRLVGNDIQVFRPAEWDRGIVDKLKVEGASSIALSPGLNPSLAVFVREKKAQPASIKVFSLNSLSSGIPTSQKSFFKADRAQLKWNTLGTQLLLLTQTEVDNSNKSYYGETGLYLLTAAGTFDCRVTLDKEGPIHDFTWSPNSREFAVVYGYMPAKTMLFDQRVRTVHDFGSAPYNFVSFNPQARLIALAGFGNLAGKIDIFDRRSLAKISTIDAPNTSYCDWSPDGRFLLTATLSPRLRVDNSVRIWHCTGPLVHIQQTDELYSALWRPQSIDSLPQFPAVIPPSPEPSQSAKDHQATAKPVDAKPKGAYRPPGARGLATPAIFKREDEGGGSGTSTPTGSVTPGGGRYGRGGGNTPVPGAPGYGSANGSGYQNQNGRRHVPGAPSGGGGQQGQGGQQGENQSRRKRKPKKGGEKGAAEDTQAPEAPTPSTPAPAPPSPPPVPPAPAVEEPQDATGLDPIAKKARNLNKKLKAIEELKEKAKRGERLEATQIRKIDGEAEIRKELAALGL